MNNDKKRHLQLTKTSTSANKVNFDVDNDGNPVYQQYLTYITRNINKNVKELNIMNKENIEFIV